MFSSARPTDTAELRQRWERDGVETNDRCLLKEMGSTCLFSCSHSATWVFPRFHRRDPRLSHPASEGKRQVPVRENESLSTFSFHFKSIIFVLQLLKYLVLETTDLANL